MSETTTAAPRFANRAEIDLPQPPLPLRSQSPHDSQSSQSPSCIPSKPGRQGSKSSPQRCAIDTKSNECRSSQILRNRQDRESEGRPVLAVPGQCRRQPVPVVFSREAYNCKWRCTSFRSFSRSSSFICTNSTPFPSAPMLRTTAVKWIFRSPARTSRRIESPMLNFFGDSR
jgi:hypothetical protein